MLTIFTSCLAFMAVRPLSAYADEILRDARIDKASIAGKIPESAIKVLWKSIGTVLTGAEKAIVKNHPYIISGEVRDFLNIHNAKKEKSPTGAKILTSSVGGRKTYTPMSRNCMYDF